VSRARQAFSASSGLVLIGLAAVAWGTTGSVMTVLGERAAASPLLVGAARLWIAAVLLLIAMLLTAERRHTRLSQATHGPIRPHGPRYNSLRSNRPRSNNLGRCVLMGACMAGYQAAYFTAVTLSGIAATALIAICSAPLIIAALAPMLLGERLTRRVRAALALGVVGTALLVAAPRGALDFTVPLVVGALLALTAGLAYALYVILAKATLARMEPLPVTALTFAAGAVLLTPAVLWTEAPLRQLALGWPWLLYLGGVATAGAYAIYTLGLRDVPASVAGIATLTEPLTATLLGVLLFGERLGVTGVGGALLLVSALALVLTPRTASADVERAVPNSGRAS
jgi:drug/metabolite transporter, DME family